MRYTFRIFLSGPLFLKCKIYKVIIVWIFLIVYAYTLVFKINEFIYGTMCE